MKKQLGALGALALLSSLALAAPPAAAQAAKPQSAGTQDVAAEIDRIFAWTQPDAPGCVVAVARHGKVVVNRAYGLADLERKTPLTPDTVFDIGSLQKQFVAAAVLLLVADGRIALSDDVRRHLPELPDYRRAITVDHLLTHTSGLRDWTALLPMSREKEPALAAILRQRGLNFPPGEEWSYSNSGFVLLKELVARTAEMPFAEFARRRLFEPLGMKATVYVENVLKGPENRARAYQKNGDRWLPDMMLGHERGGGALLSTTGDLLAWNEALTEARLGAFVTGKIQEPTKLNNGRTLGYARGLFVEDEPRRVWHTGSAGAYKGLLSRYPEQGLSIAILANGGDESTRLIDMRRILELFAPGAGAPEGTTAPAAAAGGAGIEGIDPSNRAGLFFSEDTGDPLHLAVKDGRLIVVDGPALVALSGDRFRNPRGRLSFMSQDEFELRFRSPDELELRSMEGRVTRYRRARRWMPGAADLESLSGRYESDELNAVLEIALGGVGVVGRLNGAKAIPILPVDRDTFQLGRMILRFRRDAEGKVVALDYSNPVLRRVIFLPAERLGPLKTRAIRVRCRCLRLQLIFSC